MVGIFRSSLFLGLAVFAGGVQSFREGCLGPFLVLTFGLCSCFLMCVCVFFFFCGVEGGGWGLHTTWKTVLIDH